MFEYFPGNYVWNLSIAIAMESGAQIGEINEMCAPLRDAATGGADVGTDQFLARWEEMADRLNGQAGDDVALGHRFSASTKLHRAALYYQTAERMQPHGSPHRMEVFGKGQDAFRRAVALGHDNLERIEIPYEGGVIAGWFCRAIGDGPRPTIIYVNGLDSSKEMLVWMRLGRELARRGVSTLHVDQPGSGEALRVHGLTAIYDTERWASVIIDHLEQIEHVDPARIGIVGISLGGYFAPRAMAFEPRLALGAVIGANHDWGEVQRQRLRREGENPVPHYWAHVQWVWGAASLDDFLEIRAGHPRRGARSDPCAVPRDARRERPPDQVGVRASHLRPTRQLTEARTEGLRCKHGRGRARNRRQHGDPARLHRRLDRRDVC